MPDRHTINDWWQKSLFLALDAIDMPFFRPFLSSLSDFIVSEEVFDTSIKIMRKNGLETTKLTEILKRSSSRQPCQLDNLGRAV
jgi:hypothetical protein